ncbi:MAG: hypothetical protein IPJ32_05865 [Sphingobacteriaceae bacterium]|jgi:hypothetical protein|nr:hypothetical protein [Sphingobacteriaceae bacterium]
MKTVYSLITALALIVTLQSCGGKKDEQVAVEAPAGMITLDLSKYGKPFTIFVPDSTFGKMEVIEQTWGALEIRIGKDFQLSITEDPGDVELRKTDIKGDEVNKFKSFIVEEPTTIMWESEITKPEFHFYSIQKLGNSTYVFEDIKSAEAEPFSKENIQKMLDAAKGLKEVKKAESAS